MSGGCPTRKREQKLQPGLLEPCALKGACTVLRGRGGGDTSSLPDILGLHKEDPSSIVRAWAFLFLLLLFTTPRMMAL